MIKYLFFMYKFAGLNKKNGYLTNLKKSTNDRSIFNVFSFIN